MRLSIDSKYKSPEVLPAKFLNYYSRKASYSSYKEYSVTPFQKYTVRRIIIKSEVGESIVDYFHQREQRTDSLILLFPVLGGKNLIENYFADYFAREGFDIAIIHRHEEFKDPAKVDELEDIFRNNLIRDRIVIDFFADKYNKEKFGSFGISRGAINASTTAAIDNRLKYNILMLGGSDLVGIFKDSSQPRIKNYVQSVSKNKGISEQALFEILESKISTNPKFFTKYIDARNTLLFLAVLDTTVPFNYGLQLRKEIGNPETIFLLADHFTSLFFTQIVKMFPPNKNTCIFPFDYVESESASFFRRSFQEYDPWYRNLAFRIIQAPFNLGFEAIRYIVGIDENLSTPKVFAFKAISKKTK
jgi:hypothetical protein